MTPPKQLLVSFFFYPFRFSLLFDQCVLFQNPYVRCVSPGYRRGVILG